MENAKNINENNHDLKELSQMLCKLPEKEKLKILYMIKGIELISNSNSIP